MSANNHTPTTPQSEHTGNGTPPQPFTAPSNRPRGTIVVFHPGSYDLKIGLQANDDEHPHCVPHCVAFPKQYFTSQQQQYDRVFEEEGNSDDKGQERAKQETMKERQLLAIRRDLLVSRGILRAKNKSSSSDTLIIDEEKEIYFEEMSTHRESDSVEERLRRQQTSFRSEEEEEEERAQILNLDLEERELELRKKHEQSQKTGDQQREELMPLVGQHALDTLAMLDNDQKYELYYPMWGGHFNVPKHAAQYWSQENIAHSVTMIWKHAVHDILKMSSYQIQRASAVLIIPDVMHSSEVELLMEILFKELRFKEVLVHVESVCATFGAGVQNVCVVDMGLSKTCVTVVEDGIAIKKSRIWMPFGTDNVTKCLSWIMLQCGFPQEKVLDLSRQKQRMLMNSMRERYCNLKEGSEQFHKVSFAFEGYIYNVDIGDPLFIAAMGYFYPKLFYPHRTRMFNVANMFITEETAEDVADQQELAAIADDPIINAVMSGNWMEIPVATSHSKYIERDQRSISVPGREASGSVNTPTDIVADKSENQEEQSNRETKSSNPKSRSRAESGATRVRRKPGPKSSREEGEVKRERRKPGPKPRAQQQSPEESDQISTTSSPIDDLSVDATEMGISDAEEQQAKELTGRRKRPGPKPGSRRGRGTPAAITTPTIENEADIPANAVVSLRDAVIVSLNRSEMEIPVVKRSKNMHINVLLVGGGSHINHLSEMLRKKLQEFYSSHLPKNIEPHVNIVSNERDKAYDPRFLQYKGGLFMTFLDSSSGMWISADRYEVYGMNHVKEVVQFEFDK